MCRVDGEEVKRPEIELFDYNKYKKKLEEKTRKMKNGKIKNKIIKSKIFMRAAVMTTEIFFLCGLYRKILKVQMW